MKREERKVVVVVEMQEDRLVPVAVRPSSCFSRNAQTIEANLRHSNYARTSLPFYIFFSAPLIFKSQLKLKVQPYVLSLLDNPLDSLPPAVGLQF